MFKWNLKKPLVIFDIEATGLNPRVDRIVELATLKLMPDSSRSTHVFRINPQIPIPAEATAIHHITDHDVKNCPSFADVAGDVYTLLEGCCLGGFNILHFDIPMLTEEFSRAAIPFDPLDYVVIDAQRVFHKKEPRDLSAALSFYCGEMHVDAHSAEGDVLATLRVLEGQFQKYPDLPRDIDQLSDYCNPKDPNWADKTGKLKWQNGEICVNFGKKKGTPLRKIIETDHGFIKWLLNNNFPSDTIRIVENALNGNWPQKP